MQGCILHLRRSVSAHEQGCIPHHLRLFIFSGDSPYCMQWGLSSTLPLPGSHFPVPFACWERVWVSLPLMLRAPNKASRRSSCFSFLKRVIYPTLVSKVRMGVKVRRFGSSSWGEQASLGRWQLPVVPAVVILRKNRAQPHIWSKAADMVLSLLHSGTELHSL